MAAEHPALEIREAGDVSLDDAIGEQVAEDLSAAEGISLPVTLVLMLIAFGALIAAGIPVLLAATSVAATIGITAPLSHLVHAEPTVSSMIVLIGMAVGVDYSLFYLKREREERAKGASTLDAVEIAAATSGHSIVVSGLAVIASMTGLYVFGGATFNSLATGSILVVAIAVLGSITVLPGAAGPARPLGGPPAGAAAVAAQPSHRQGWAEPPHPRSGAAPSGRGPGGLRAGGRRAEPAGVRHEAPGGEPRHPARRDPRGHHVPGDGGRVPVRGHHHDRGGARRTPASGSTYARRSTTSRHAPPPSGEFEATADAVQVSADGRTSVLRLGLPYDESDPRVEDAVDTLRADLAPPALDELHAEYAVGGDAAEARDFVRAAAHLAADRGRRSCCW